MGTGKKVAIGCGGFLALFSMAGYGGWRWLENNLGMTMDTAVIAERLGEIAPLSIPDVFVSTFSSYTETPRRNPMLMYVAAGSRNQETSLVIYQREGFLSEEDLRKEVLDGGSGMRIKVGLESIGEEERFPVTFQGQEYSALLQEGMDKNQLVERLILVVIPAESHTLMVVMDGDPTLIHRNLLQTILDPTVASEAGTLTPPTDAGKTSMEDQ